MKLSDLKSGDTIVVDGGFPCMSDGPKTVHVTNNKDFYVICRDGRHFLSGQEDENGELIGISKPNHTTPKTSTPERFVVGSSNTDEAVVIYGEEAALQYATDLADEGDTPLLWRAYSIPLEVETTSRVTIRRSL